MGHIDVTLSDSTLAAEVAARHLRACLWTVILDLAGRTPLAAEDIAPAVDRLTAGLWRPNPAEVTLATADLIRAGVLWRLCRAGHGPASVFLVVGPGRDLLASLHRRPLPCPATLPGLIGHRLRRSLAQENTL